LKKDYSALFVVKFAKGAIGLEVLGNGGPPRQLILNVNNGLSSGSGFHCLGKMKEKALSEKREKEKEKEREKVRKKVRKILSK